MARHVVVVVARGCYQKSSAQRLCLLACCNRWAPGFETDCRQVVPRRTKWDNAPKANVTAFDPEALSFLGFALYRQPQTVGLLETLSCRRLRTSENCCSFVAGPLTRVQIRENGLKPQHMTSNLVINLVVGGFGREQQNSEY